MEGASKLRNLIALFMLVSGVCLRIGNAKLIAHLLFYWLSLATDHNLSRTASLEEGRT